MTLDGEPLANAAISFSPMAGGRPSAGVTDSSGKFELQFSESEKGAVVGAHTVRITTVDPHSAPRNNDGTLGTPPGEVVPAKYLEPNALVEDVFAGENSIEIALTSK